MTANSQLTTPSFDITVIGLGYVGLPLSRQFARKGAPVLGLDIDQVKVDAINHSKPIVNGFSTIGKLI